MPRPRPTADSTAEAEDYRPPRFVIGYRSPVSCERVRVLGGCHAAYGSRGIGLSVPYVSSPRALVAGLLSAICAVGGNEGGAGCCAL